MKGVADFMRTELIRPFRKRRFWVICGVLLVIGYLFRIGADWWMQYNNMAMRIIGKKALGEVMPLFWEAVFAAPANQGWNFLIPVGVLFFSWRDDPHAQELQNNSKRYDFAAWKVFLARALVNWIKSVLLWTFAAGGITLHWIDAMSHSFGILPSVPFLVIVRILLFEYLLLFCVTMALTVLTFFWRILIWPALVAAVATAMTFRLVDPLAYLNPFTWGIFARNYLVHELAGFPKQEQLISFVPDIIDEAALVAEGRLTMAVFAVIGLLILAVGCFSLLPRRKG